MRGQGAAPLVGFGAKPQRLHFMRKKARTGSRPGGGATKPVLSRRLQGGAGAVKAQSGVSLQSCAVRLPQNYIREALFYNRLRIARCDFPPAGFSMRFRGRNGSFKRRWRGRNCRLRLLSDLRFLGLRMGTLGVLPPNPCLRDCVPQTPLFASRLWPASLKLTVPCAANPHRFLIHAQKLLGKNHNFATNP